MAYVRRSVLNESSPLRESLKEVEGREGASLPPRQGLQELAQQSRDQQPGRVPRNPSTATLPPAYEALMGASASHVGVGGGGPAELPPPTYEEAMFLVGDEKLQVELEDCKYAASSDDELNKEACALSASHKGHLEVQME